MNSSPAPDFDAPRHAPRARRGRATTIAGGTAVLLAALPLAACLPTPGGPAGPIAPTTTAVPASTITTASSVPTTIESTVTTLPLDPPTTTTSTPPPTTTTTKDLPPVESVIEVRADGLGIVDYGDAYDGALADLIAELGAPDNPGTVTGPVQCGVVARRDVRWDDLTVSFSDKGSGLRVSGFHWGDVATRNTTASHPSPAGPGRPTVGNPWDVRIGTPVRHVGDLVEQVRVQYPTARLQPAPPPLVDDAVVAEIGIRRLHVGLHDGPDHHLVERIWVFDPAELFC